MARLRPASCSKSKANVSLAEVWYRMAAKQRDATAQVNVGRPFLHSDGVPQKLCADYRMVHDCEGLGSDTADKNWEATECLATHSRSPKYRHEPINRLRSTFRPIGKIGHWWPRQEHQWEKSSVSAFDEISRSTLPSGTGRLGEVANGRLVALQFAKSGFG